MVSSHSRVGSSSTLGCLLVEHHILGLQVSVHDLNMKDPQLQQYHDSKFA